MPEKVVLFDCDGTIADNWGEVYESVCALFQHFGKTPPSLEEYCTRLRISGDYKSNYAGYGIHADREELNAVFIPHYQSIMDRVELALGARDLLMFLKGAEHVATYLVTTNVHENVVPILEWFDILDLFDGLHFHVLDKAEAITCIRKRAGVSVENCYYIGDTPSDMRHANAAGVRSVAYLNKHVRHILEEPLRAEAPWLITDSLASIRFLAA